MPVSECRTAVTSDCMYICELKSQHLAQLPAKLQNGHGPVEPHVLTQCRPLYNQREDAISRFICSFVAAPSLSEPLPSRSTLAESLEFLLTLELLTFVPLFFL